MQALYNYNKLELWNKTVAIAACIARLTEHTHNNTNNIHAQFIRIRT